MVVSDVLVVLAGASHMMYMSIMPGCFLVWYFVNSYKLSWFDLGNNNNLLLSWCDLGEKKVSYWSWCDLGKNKISYWYWCDLGGKNNLFHKSYPAL